MSAFNARRPKETKHTQQNNRTIRKIRKKRQSNRCIRQSLRYLILCGFVLIMFLTLFVDYIPWHFRHGTVNKAVKVFDYYEPDLDGHFELDKELFMYAKPSLSYAGTPGAHTEQYNRLIRKIRKKRQSNGSIRESLVYLILSGFVFTIVLTFSIDYIPWHLRHRAVDKIVNVFGYYEPVHAVVIDAGSTGSRVLAFTFHKAYLDGHLELDKELYINKKPGLSSYADNPEAGAATIANLIEKAKEEIPQQYWSSTPLILKATAGLRLLPPQKAEALLTAVKDLFKRTPFLTNDDSVSIMDGTDEGIFSWFTVNFLLGLFNYDPTRTVAALDLGGGSTQITFYATNSSSFAEKQFIHDGVTPVGVIPVYTRSYLGLGLMATRKEVITINQTNKTNVVSECVNPIVENYKFHYSGVDYYVSGPDEYMTKSTSETVISSKQELPVVDFDKCSKYITNYVLRIAKPPKELLDKRIYAFSYYVSRAADSNLINKTTGGQVKVNDFKRVALKACSEVNIDQPFMCLDLTFIWVLLERGLGLRSDTTVFLFKKIMGHEISWALGSAYSLLQR